jgi:hypothetical protein
MDERFYYLDRDLSLAESTRRFADGGREIPEERHYVAAIRRRGHLGWVFRFSRHFHDDLESIVGTLNRPPRSPLTTELTDDYATDRAVTSVLRPESVRA